MRIKKLVAGVLALLLTVSMIPVSTVQAAKKSGFGFEIDGKLTDRFYGVVLKKGESINWSDENSKTSVSSNCNCKKRDIYTNHMGFTLKGDTNHVKVTKADYNVFVGFSDGKPVYEKESALTSVVAKDGPVIIYGTDTGNAFFRQVDLRCWGPNDKGVQYGDQCETQYYYVGTPYKVEYLGGNSIEASLDLNGGAYASGDAGTVIIDVNDMDKSVKNIEMPVREGYVFEGWIIQSPNCGGCRLVSCEDGVYSKCLIELNELTWDFIKDMVMNGAKLTAIWTKDDSQDDGEVKYIDFWEDGKDSEVVYSSVDPGVEKEIEGINYDPSKNRLDIKDLPGGSNVEIAGTNININVEGNNNANLIIYGESDKSGTITISGNGTLDSSRINIDAEGGDVQVKIEAGVSINVSNGGFTVEDTTNPNPVVIANGTGISKGELNVDSNLRPEYDDGRIIVSKDGKNYNALQYKSLGEIKIFEIGSWEPIDGKSIKWDGKTSVIKTLENAGYVIKRTEKKVYTAAVSADEFTISSKYAKNNANEKDGVKKVIINVRPLSKKTKAEVVFLSEGDADKYEIRYSTSAKMTGSKTVTVKAKKNAAIVIAKLKKLKAKKTYYIQVREIGVDGSGNKTAGSWSKVWKYKVK